MARRWEDGNVTTKPRDNDPVAGYSLSRYLSEYDTLIELARAFYENPASIEARKALGKALGE